MTPTPDKPLTTREKIILRLVLFTIQMLKPYDFEYQFKDTIIKIAELLNSEQEK